MGAGIARALLTAEPHAKAMATRRVARDFRLGRLTPRFAVAMPDEPSRPSRPQLLPPREMPKRGRGGSERVRIALIHALAHIEFSAIDLALDTAGRFGRAMKPEFTADFLAVAADEAMHFAMLDRRLRALGSSYGELPAHGGLWEAAEATRDDVAARLAIVPLVLEARALDVTPATIERARQFGDESTARILERILDDEIRHVAIGGKWFRRSAELSGDEPGALWKSLVKRHFRGVIKPPFNDSARAASGLPREWYGGIV